MLSVEPEWPPFAAPLRAVDRCVPLDRAGAERRLVAYKTVDARDPYMAGHFPGMAMFPAVFLLEAVRQVLVADRTSRGGQEVGNELLTVHSTRLHAPMREGDEIRLDITLRPGEHGTDWTVRAEGARGDGVPVAELRLRVGHAGREPALTPGQPPETGDSPHAGHVWVREKLPVRHPMLLVDSVQDLSAYNEIVTSKAVTGSEPCYANLPDGLGVEAYAYPRSLVLESFGQSAALLWLSSADLGVGNGVLMLAAVRDCRFTAAVQPGETLYQVVRLDHQVGHNAFFTGETWAGGRCVATIGTLIAASRPVEMLHVRHPASRF